MNCASFESHRLKAQDILNPGSAKTPYKWIIKPACSSGAMLWDKTQRPVERLYFTIRAFYGMADDSKPLRAVSLFYRRDQFAFAQVLVSLNWMSKTDVSPSASTSQVSTITETLIRFYVNRVKLFMQNLVLLTALIFKDGPSSSSES